MPRVALFATCLVDLIRPEVGEATIKVLERAGVDVVVPEGQTCCGQPLWNTGDRRAARPFIEHWLEVFSEFDAVVSPSGSCVAMVRHQYHRAFDGEQAAEVQTTVESTYELSEYLVAELGITDLGVSMSGRAAYHPACHGLRGLGLAEEPLALLNAVDGLQVRALPDECCGFGGFFSMRFPEVSTALADERLEFLADADLLVSGDLSCLMHLSGRLERLGRPLPALHLAEVLAR